MPLRRSACTIALGLLMTGATSTNILAADEWPDLLGQWSGESRAVVSAGGDHYETQEHTDPVFVSQTLMIEWTEQEDGRLIGVITSEQHSEPKMAVIGSDRKSLSTVDANGSSTGSILDDDSFELCYTQTGPAVVSCVVFTRVR